MLIVLMMIPMINTLNVLVLLNISLKSLISLPVSIKILIQYSPISIKILVKPHTYLYNKNIIFLKVYKYLLINSIFALNASMPFLLSKVKMERNFIFNLNTVLSIKILLVILIKLKIITIQTSDNVFDNDIKDEIIRKVDDSIYVRLKHSLMKMVFLNLNNYIMMFIIIKLDFFMI